MWGPIHVLDDLIFHISFVSIFLIQNDWYLWGWWMMFDVGTDIFQPIERETTITLFFPSSHSAQTLATKKQLEAEDLYKLNEAPVNVSVIVHVHKQPQHFLSFLHQSCSDL